MDQPTADAVLRGLDPLVGEWALEASPPGGDPWPGGGRCTFEWHASGAHLVQRTAVQLPEAPDSLCIIGCDGANGGFVQLYADERGVSRIFDMSIDEGTWKLWRTGEPFAQRFTATISPDGDTITGRWERSDDGMTYETDFDLVYRRIIG